MITVIVPVYNSSAYIRQCLDSVLAQNFNDFEVICVDDGSTDESSSILFEYSERFPNIKVVSQNNKGRSCARNTGIFHAKGEFVCFVDSDDELKPNALNMLYSKVSEEVDAVVSSIEVQYTAHEEKEDQDFAYYRISRDSIEKVSTSKLATFHSSVCASLFRREIILKNKIFFPESLNFEDAFFHWTYFLYTDKVAFIKNTTYIYVRRPNSIMSRTFNGSLEALDHLFIGERIIQFYKQRGMFFKNETILLNLLSKYFWFAFRYVPHREKCKVISECARILSENKLSVNTFEDLKAINTGNVGKFFQIPIDENALLSIEITKILNKSFPSGTKRNKILLLLARKVYTLLKKR